MCCGGGAPPPPDYGPIASANEASARYAKEAADADLAFRRQVYNDSLPQREELYQLAREVAEQQLGITDESAMRGREQWQEYQDTYLPVERRMVQDAMEYDSPDRRERLRSEAMADTSSALGAQNAVIAREMARYGVNPNSGRFQGTQRQGKLLGAAATAGAGNAAVRGLEDKAISLRAGAASFGRNMPNTAGQALGLATQAGNSAVGNQNAAFMSGMPYAQFAAGGTGNQIGAAGMAMQGNLGLGNLMNQNYQAQMSAHGQGMAGLGQLAGLVGYGLVV